MRSERSGFRSNRAPFAVLLAMSVLVPMLAVATGVSPAVAQSEASEHSATSQLQYSVVVDGDYAVLGAAWHDGFKGAAYIFQRRGDGWGEPQKISPPDLGWYDHFGTSVSIRGDRAVVGAPWQDLFRGAAYVFKRVDGVWVEEQKLSASDAAPDGFFGQTVAIDGDEIKIGAGSGDSELGLEYSFQRVAEAWTEMQVTALAWGEIEGQPGGPAIETLADFIEASLAEHIADDSEAAPLLVLGALEPPDTVVATDEVFEDRVEIVWSSVGLDAIIYKIIRDSTLISVASSEDTLFQDYTGQPGIEYEYCVAVKDMGGGESDWLCDDGSRVIFQPILVSASDGDHDRLVRVIWNDMSYVETGYLIKRNGAEIGNTGANVEVFDDTTAVPKVTYNYEVIAFDAEGYRSRAVSDSGFRGLIMPPLAVNASDGEYPDHVKITWRDQAKNEEGYNIYRGDSLIAATGVDTKAYDDSTAAYGVPYQYCVRTLGSGLIESIPVCDEGGVGILPAPDSVSASDSTFDDHIEITWEDPSDLEDGFEIRRDGAVIDTTRANVGIYKDFGATENTTHQYCVVAFSNEGGRSVPVCDSGFQSVVLAPFDIAATDGEYEDRVLITWKSTSTTAVLFKILRDGTFIKSVSRDARTYSDFGGVAGREYDYSVVAVTALEVEAEGKPDKGRRQLRAPTAVTASDEEYEDRIVISWTDNSQVENGFVVSREDTPAGLVVTIGEKRPNITSFTDRTAVPGVTYRYSVAAFDTLGGERGESEAESDEGCRVLLAPTKGQATDGEFEDRVEITWQDNSNAEDGYYIDRDDVRIASTAYNFTSFTDTGPNFGQVSEYTVVAYDALGTSQVASDYGYTTILAPASFNASEVYADRIELTWVDLSEIEEGYRIERDGDLLTTTARNANSYTDASAQLGMTYKYCMEAVKGDARSEQVCDSGCCILPSSEPTPEPYGEGKLLQALVVGDVADTANFGDCVAIDGDRAMVGAPHKFVPGKGTLTGAAYIFERGADGKWSCAERFVAVDHWDTFGNSVAMDGDRVIAGAYNRELIWPYPCLCDGSLDPGDSSTWPPGFDPSIPSTYGLVLCEILLGETYIYERGGDGTWAKKTLTPLKLEHREFPTSPVWCYEYDWLFPEVCIKHLSSGTYNVNVQKSLFGSSVAIDGDWALVGAMGDDNFNGVDAGAAYLFVRKFDGTWDQMGKLAASDGEAYEWFGRSVAIDGQVLMVGAPYNDKEPAPGGKAYIFEQLPGGTWNEDVLSASDGAPWYQFGYSVAIDGDIAIVGAMWADGRKGAAYIFQRGAGYTWVEAQKLTASDGEANDWFGTSVAIERGRVIVGAVWADGTKGAAYIFQRGAGDRWVEVEKLTASDGEAYDAFGISVAIDNNQVIVGAQCDDDQALDAGSAYVFDFIWPPGDVAASDGSLKSRVRVTWQDHSSNEDGFRVYRDGVPVVDSLAADTEVYEDFDTQPGRTYEYGVVAFIKGRPEHAPVCDFGWRRANGNITGRVSTRAGAGVEAISVCLNPQPSRALLFDGTGGHVRIPDEEGAFNPGAAGDFTVEFWFKYSGSGGSDATLIAKTEPLESPEGPFPFRISNLCSEGAPGQLEVTMSDGDNPVSVRSQQTHLNDDTWHHFACVHDGGQDLLKVYVDGELKGTGTSSGLGDIANDDDLFLGVGYWPDTWFRGQLDEIRIWNTVRTTEQIQTMKTRQLTGSEDGLVGYWPLDGGTGEVITDLTDGSHYGRFQDGVYWTDNTAPLDVCATTDEEGNYALPKVRYGDETTFKVRPFQGERQFEPAFKTITLSTEHAVENQVNFIEITSFTVAGFVKFEGTECFAPNMEILVDGQVRSRTDKNGNFAVSVDKGDHWIRPRSEGHTFKPDSLLLHVESDTSGIAFTNTTKRTLAGRVGGGCGRLVGTVTITVRSETPCINLTRTADSFYELTLPPQKYLVSAQVDEDAIPDGLLKSDVVTFFDNLGEREVDLTTKDDSLHFIYRAPLRVSIRGLKDWVPSCTQLTFEGRTLPESLPVIPQGTVLDLTIEVGENYGTEICPLDSGIVVVYDEIFDQEDSPQKLIVKDGEAVYTTFASTPSLIVGRVDSKGNDRSFQKAIRAMVVVEGKTPKTVTEWALVTGHVAQEGTDFVTATATPVPLYILRDPPGDRSYAYLEKGHTSHTTIDWEKSLNSGGGGPDIQLKWGLDETWFVGVGAGRITRATAQHDLQISTYFGGCGESEAKTVFTLTTKEKFSTSADDLFAGEPGDVFIGTGFNLLFAEANVIGIEGCEVTRAVSLGFQPDTLHTLFAYSEHYIRNVLMEELKSKVNHYQALGDSDSVSTFQAYLYTWQEMLEENRRLKRDAKKKTNRSFSTGADFEYFHESDTTESYTHTQQFVTDESINAGFGTSIFGIGTRFGLKAKFHHEHLTDSQDTTGTRTLTVGYMLSDDNLGDHFTVDIKEDGRYPTPVFDVLGGVSSCPYEPWPDTEGVARMTPRDEPELLFGSDPELSDIPPDEPAVFTLHLSNLSQTGETRKYVLREIGTSNPGGAILSANGAGLSDGLLYFVAPWDPEDPGRSNAQELTLTVERGPTRYAYDSLAVMAYAPCEWDIHERGGPMRRADTLFFSVHFDAPCSDITLMRPKPGWVVNKAVQDSADSLELWLTDYEIIIGADAADRVTSVGVQCRYLGTGREGPGEWTDIPADSLGEVETIIDWLPDVGSKDGIYELRAFTWCQGGRGFSAVSVGTIDRNAPQVFGKPEPADGILSFGENISITFNELIDCEAIDADSVTHNVTLTYLDGPEAGSTIPVKTVCDGRTIIIAPTAQVDPNDLEGRSVEARVAGIRDVVGNPMVEEATWTFEVRQSVFTWSRASLTTDVAFRAPGIISAELVNGSDETATVDTMIVPTWITGISDSTPSLAPGKRQTIRFTIQPDLPRGEYLDQEVVASFKSGDGVAVLKITLTVSCHEPDWSLDPSKYEHTMTIVAEVDIDGDISDDPNDQVAVFVGSQLRGLSTLEPVRGSHMAFLTVYSNRSSGETVRFQVWDADSCRLYNSTLERVTFESNRRVGSPYEPLTLTAIDILPDTVQVIPLGQGWNWFSTNLRAVDMSVNGVLSDLTPAAGDMIKSHTAFATFDPQMGWVGELELVDNVSCYKVRLSEPGSIIQEGSPVDTLIPVDVGWNWIGYLAAGPMAVDRALCDLNRVLSNGDVVKNQTAFAQYTDKGEAGWSGDLAAMEPGKGYMLYLKKVSANTGERIPGFNYPPYVGGTPSTPLADGAVDGADLKAATPQGIPGWSVNENAYQYNMTLIAVAETEGNEWRSGGDMIGAFVDGTCRGVTSPIYLTGTDRYVAFLMIHSDRLDGEAIAFKVFDAGSKTVYTVSEVIAFEADRAEGTVREPLVLSTKSIEGRIEDGLPVTYGLSQNRPNPFSGKTTIRFQLPETNHVVLRIYDALGREVRQAINRPYEAGYHRFVWDGRDNQGRIVASGIYFCNFKAGEFEDMKKMVVLD